MAEPKRIDFILSTISATDIGSMETIVDKLRQVQAALSEMDQADLSARANDAVAALERGDLAEFRRLRALLQAKVGHLR
jgi:hypothetical protein